MGIRCGGCGEEHDISNIEPSYLAPDVIRALPDGVWQKRAKLTKNFAALPADDRFFLRVLVPFRVEGRKLPCSWGLWVEVAPADFQAVGQLWDAPDQADHGPWPATLANDAATYPSTLGLRGSVHFADPNQIPHLRLDPEQDHPFIADWKRGVSEAQVMKWLEPFLHGQRSTLH
ncbi:MAG: DUF2199 domain-containing protein [Polyangiaceae bacterium]|nr:DUF2199 domain-containing protein [Polyangiaceae bacterium]